ncbi:hypothetical protein [Shewanella nanhaiensis]|uniref:Uncharacterized protein n=1 Tax=Shewanella nanhaiensis TaxID=2864872 RepID=A0ABS7E9L5_9GAMM|nr:hypothetical protein [Shewanella nanhaiensis]MBW8186360.1 hypothetical protein [Shewanella nanhaiensis]
MNKSKPTESMPDALREQILVLQEKVNSLESELAQSDRQSLNTSKLAQFPLTEDELKMIYAQF